MLKIEEEDSIDAAPSLRHVEWGVKWHQQPAWMIVSAFSGMCLAVGHHVYYSRLDHTPAGNEGRQQWAHTFGNIFAVAVATLFAVANRMAYKQYFWTIVRRKSFTLKSLDSLFSLTSDLLGFLEADLWKRSPLAVVLAFICWQVPHNDSSLFHQTKIKFKSVKSSYCKPGQSHSPYSYLQDLSLSLLGQQPK